VATIFDVARLANVGVGTVSRVLNDGAVAAATRGRVEAAITELGFRPSRVARNLSTGTTSTIAAMVPFVGQSAVTDRLRGLVAAFADTSYDLTIVGLESPEQRDRNLARFAASGEAAGAVIIATPLAAKDVAAFGRTGTPIVLLETRLDGYPSVWIDDHRGGRMAADHLLGLGHRRIAFVGHEEHPSLGVGNVARRLDGLRAAMADAAAPLAPQYVRMGAAGRRDVARKSTAYLLSMPRPPTAIFAASDVQAFGVFEAARHAGLAIPGDLSVIGFDDIDHAEPLGLTTIRQQLERSGALGGEMLLRMLNHEMVGSRELELSVIVRTSTAPPRATGDG